MMTLLLTGCSVLGQDAGPLDPKGTTGEEQLQLINLSLGIMIIVMLAVFALFFYVIIRYRRKKGDDSIPKQVEGNHKLEIIWTVIPILLLVVLAVPTLAITFGQATDYTEDPEAMVVKVYAHQFWWEFEYPEQGIVTAQDLVLPVNKKVQFEVQSSDVLHSFWIPGIGGKIDTLPGQTNRTYLEPTEVGVFKGKCAELCGTSHAYMDFKADVRSQEDFDAWVASMTEPYETVAEEDKTSGQMVFESACMQCHAVDSGQASLGPNLKGIANRNKIGGYKENTDEWKKAWITDPQKVKPGNEMPNAAQLGLSEQDVEALVEYLNTLD